jgi:hypothetical protein
LLSTSHTERNFPFFGARIVAKIERKQQDRRIKNFFFGARTLAKMKRKQQHRRNNRSRHFFFGARTVAKIEKKATT